MDVREAVTVAKQHVTDLFADDPVQNLRMEEFLYDDHLGVWSITLGYTHLKNNQDGRLYKVVRVSQADKIILSVATR